MAPVDRDDKHIHAATILLPAPMLFFLRPSVDTAPEEVVVLDRAWLGITAQVQVSERKRDRRKLDTDQDCGSVKGDAGEKDMTVAFTG